MCLKISNQRVYLIDALIKSKIFKSPHIHSILLLNHGYLLKGVPQSRDYFLAIKWRLKIAEIDNYCRNNNSVT